MRIRDYEGNEYLLCALYMILSKDGVVRYSHSGYIPGEENTLFKELKKVLKNNEI